jgi:hypothetical protein
MISGILTPVLLLAYFIDPTSCRLQVHCPSGMKDITAVETTPSSGATGSVSRDS